MELSRSTKRASFGLAGLSGILLGFAYPPFGLVPGFFAFFAIVPMLVSLGAGTRLRDAFWRAWLGMFVFGLLATYWVGGWNGMGEVDSFLMLGGVMLMFVHPFFLVIPFVLYDLVRRRWGRTPALILLPIFFGGFEYWQSFGDLSFPWLSLFNTQTYNTAFIQFIEFTGPYALSMLLVGVNVLLFVLLTFERRPRLVGLTLAGLLLLLGLPYYYGNQVLHEQERTVRSLTISVIQPNINPWAKWQSDVNRIMDTNYAATASAVFANHGATQLFVWPETAIPFPITTESEGYQFAQFSTFLDSLNRPLLTGFPDEEFFLPGQTAPADAKPTKTPGVSYRAWNSAMLTFRDNSGRKVERYHKQLLVPLGEHVPFIDQIPILGKIFTWTVGLGSWNRGTGYDLLNLPIFSKTTREAIDTAKLSTLICYESIYPSFVRNFVDRGAEVLIIITNDGWYGKSPGPFQHNQFAVLRAIENRRWVARSANTGISSFIDDKGRFREQTPLFEQTSITERVPLLEQKTLYVEWGDYIAIPCEWASGLLALYFFGGWLWVKVAGMKNRTGKVEPTPIPEG